MRDADGLLRIIRGNGWADSRRAYRILVDGREIARIRGGGRLDVALPVGRHSLSAQVDWGRSAPLEVEIRSRVTTEITVRNTFGPWLSLYAITLGRDRYLTLETVVP